MVLGRKIYNGIAPEGGTPDHEPQYVARNENDAPPATLKKQLLEIQERAEYNQLIAHAAEDNGEEQEVPEKIKESHKCWWWFVFVLFITTSIGCIVALKIFDALIALMIGIWAYYLVKD